MIRNFCGLLAVAFVALQLAGCGGSCSDYFSYEDDVNMKRTQISYVDSVGGDSAKIIRADFVDPKYTAYRIDRLSFKLVGDVDFWIDVYGCETHDCPEATSVVVHNEDYSYERLILPEDFKVKEFNGGVKAEDGDQVIYLFHLDVDTDDVSLSWNIQVWKHFYEQCSYDINPMW